MSGPVHWRAAQFWCREGSRIACELCPFECVLPPGAVGLCRVRRHEGDGLLTATFASAVRHLDPIERKPLYHFRPGRRALTLAAPGCTFRCDYCQNARLSQYGREPEAVWRAQPVDVSEAVAAAQAADGLLALSYSEPTLAAELTLALFDAASESGVELVWKTNGYITAKALARVAPTLAAVNVDLKAAQDRAHRDLTGAPLAPVLHALEGFAAHGAWLEVSTPLIPDFNTDDEHVWALARAVRALGADVPWHLLRVHPDYRRAASIPTPLSVLARAVDIAHATGLRYVYVERALGADGRATHCPACGTPVVSRTLWGLQELKLMNGTCSHCGEPVPGRW